MSEDSAECPPTKKIKIDMDDNMDDTETFYNDDLTGEGTEDFTSDDKYNNFVTEEEIEKLKEFKVLDEVKSNDEDSNDQDSDSSDEKSEELPEEEIEKMLEEGLPENFKGAPQPKQKTYVTRQKTVLEEKGVNDWEVLPLDWMMVRHYSGVPVYLHRASRVCTLAKPYFLGKGNSRRHDIPLSAIPCLAYKRALEEEKKQAEIDRNIEEQIKNGTWANNVNATDKDREITNDNSNQDTFNKCPSKSDDVSHNSNASDTNSEIKNSGVISKCPFISNSSKVNSNETCPVTGKNTAEEADAKQINDEAKSEEKTAYVDFNTDKVENNAVETTAVCTKKESKSNNASEDKDQSNEVGGSNTVDTPKETSKDSGSEIPRCRQPIVLPGGIVMPPPKVETINSSWKTQHLSYEQVNEYCKKLFKFKTVNIMHFNRWADRRKFTKARKTLQYPTLPNGTKLITIPARPANSQDGGKPSKPDWVMNMDGRSYLSVFHEYVRRALQKQPVYEFVQLENAATPYQAKVYIGGMQYGVGHGTSKRQAKSAAARASIHILIPEMKDELDASAAKDPDFSFFDYVGIEDPRISEFCAATCEPSPHAILRTCLLRNFGVSDRHIHTEMKKLEFQKIELTMKVGKHTASVVCKNKKTAKQRASQAILQALHPHVRSWGSLLRLYGSRSVKSCQQRRLEEQQVTLLQDQARRHRPNRAVLRKLRAEMRKLRQRDRAVVPIGTLLLQDSLPTHSSSNLNNVDL